MELSPRLYRRFVRPKWYPKLFIDSVIKRYFDFNDRLVLDFGCGVGSNSILFQPDYYIGVDCDEGRVSYAHDLYPDYDFKVFEKNSLPVSGNSVDYVLIISVLHHIPARELPVYLEDFRRVLKPEGRVIAFEPCFFNDCNMSNLFMDHFDKGLYIRNKERYLEIFENNNYKIDTCERHKQLLYNKLFFTAVPQ